MYVPPAYREDDPATLRQIMEEAGLATLVTATAEGLIATPLPLLVDAEDNGAGILVGHIARANPQWRQPVIGDALVIFQGPHAYVTPSWYAAKREHGKVVPTWNYVAVHVYGRAEFFEDQDGLRAVVDRLTATHERPRAEPWALSDAPADFVASQLKGIVGVRIAITRIEGKRKLSQNRSPADRNGVADGLLASEREMDHTLARLIPRDR